MLERRRKADPERAGSSSLLKKVVSLVIVPTALCLATYLAGAVSFTGGPSDAMMGVT